VSDLPTACSCSCTCLTPTDPWRHFGLGVLAEYVPTGLIDEVLVATGRVQQRVRRLPARVTVLFVLALTLFADLGYRSVWRELAHNGDIGGDGGMAGDPPPSSSGLAQARRRVGLAPLTALFTRVRGTHASIDTPGAFRFGLRLVAWDATMLDVPDSHDNAEAFIRSGNRRGGAAFPKVRLMTLIEVGTHAVIDATFGPDSEQVQAQALLASLQPGMLLLADRNFPSWRLWNAAAATGAHLLWRAKTSLHLPRIATFTDGSWLAVLPQPRTGRRIGTWVRVIEYTVTVTATCPTTGTVTTRTELFRLITTITNPTLAPAAELAACYRERWESETCFKSIKTHQRGPRAVLRSTDPDGIRQEIYAYLITYQAIRQLIIQAATSIGIDPDRLSFTTALRTVRRWITTTATTARTAALDEISQDTQHRRDRSNPRAVKRSQAPYPAKRHATQQRSTRVAYHIDVIPDPHA
jgi:Insertion element 4 transposase N-terminal/Transposase DDE domain